MGSGSCDDDLAPRAPQIFGGDPAPRYVGLQPYHLLRWRLPIDSLAADLIRLASDRKLIHQSHSALEQKGLLIPGGGLCNTTCVAAVVLAQAAAYPLSAREVGSHFELIVAAVEGVSAQRGHDARMGSHIHDGMEYLTQLVDSGLLPDSLRIVKTYGVGIESHIYFDPGEIFVMSIFMNGQGGRSFSSHAIILLAINPETKTLLVFDPNLGGHLIELSYVSLGFQQVVLNLGYGNHARFQGGAKIKRVTLRSLPLSVQERLSR